MKHYKAYTNVRMVHDNELDMEVLNENYDAHTMCVGFLGLQWNTYTY